MAEHLGSLADKYRQSINPSLTSIPTSVNPPLCPIGKCDGSGWLLVEGGMAPCGCREIRRVERLFGEARVPLRYRNASMETLLLSKDHANRRAVEMFANIAEPGKDPCALILTGAVGTGKTFVGYAVLNALIRRGYPGIAETVPNVLDTLRATQLTDAGQQKLRALQDISVLLLDDLGAHRDSAFVLERLFMVINHRYNEMLLTIVTMNGEFKDFLLTDPQTALGWDRLFSRLREMAGGEVLTMPGTDRRMRSE